MCLFMLTKLCRSADILPIGNKIIVNYMYNEVACV